jgi:dethiobiotin synthetase
MNAVLITGTDTEVGKTIVCGLLARYLLDKGYNAITQKWIQTGSSGFPIDIAMHLKLMGKKKADIEKHLPLINPYTFTFAASPHLAAPSEKRKISATKIKNSFKSLTKQFDFVIVEATGGALVPYNHKNLIIDIAKDLKLSVIIVAKNKLGAINHTLLTIEAIKSRHMKIMGIAFNSSPKKENKIILRDNPKIIKTLSGEQVLGTLPWSKNPSLLYKAFIPIGDKILTQLSGKAQK